MANLPNITAAEVAVVATAVLLFFVAPAVLAWTDARRRRRQQPVPDWPALAPTATSTAEPYASLSGPLQPPLPAEHAAPPESELAVAAAVTSDGSTRTAAPEADKETATAAQVGPAEPCVEAVDVGGVPAIELQPLQGSARHHFHLGDLHEAHLPDWPPAAIQNDSERRRAWHEAEQAIEQHRATINAATIWSPYPARSSCLGAALLHGAICELRFLLFPVVWPVSQNQAVAQAVFEIDRSQGSIRGWVDALRSHELTDENRQEIREAGGDAS